jgi:shikimate dehydrogenase
MTARYAVIGNPISHSKSPWIHGIFARGIGHDFTYEALHAPLDGFSQVVHEFRAAGGKGLNVTVPFKVQAFELATHASPRARAAGAVNALKFEGDEIFAENFDGVGLVRDVTHNLGVSIKNKRVLVLGAGGATRGVVLPLCEHEPATVVIVNRDQAKAAALQAQFAQLGPVSSCGYEHLGNNAFDVVINATSASLSNQLPPITARQFAPGALAYEMVYGKGFTPFLTLARSANVAQVADGAGMLVEQAAEACNWWRGVRPDTGDLIKQMGLAAV